MQQQSLEAWGADRTAGSDPSMLITSYINIGHSIISINELMNSAINNHVYMDSGLNQRGLISKLVAL